MQKNAVGSVVKSVSETQAAQEMWIYYKDNKAVLASDIREYRDFILGRLMQGISSVEAFAPFMQSTEPFVSSKETCKKRKTMQREKHLRAPWPFTTT